MGKFLGGSRGTKTRLRKGTTQQQAAAIINLYTQACFLSKSSTVRFYEQLNTEIRSKTPREFWERTRILLDQALEVMGPSAFNVLFRGFGNLDETPNIGEEFAFGTTTSTSLENVVALQYTTGILFVICDAVGTRVSTFSAYPNQAEILLKSTATYEVTQVSEDIDEIKTLLKPYENVYIKVPPKIVGLKMKSRRRKRGKKRARIGKARTRAGDRVAKARRKKGKEDKDGVDKLKEVKKTPYSTTAQRKEVQQNLYEHFCQVEHEE